MKTVRRIVDLLKEGNRETAIFTLNGRISAIQLAKIVNEKEKDFKSRMSEVEEKLNRMTRENDELSKLRRRLQEKVKLLKGRVKMKDEELSLAHEKIGQLSMNKEVSSETCISVCPKRVRKSSCYCCDSD